jgi:hypothetical protein
MRSRVSFMSDRQGLAIEFQVADDETMVGSVRRIKWAILKDGVVDYLDIR